MVLEDSSPPAVPDFIPDDPPFDNGSDGSSSHQDLELELHLDLNGLPRPFLGPFFGWTERGRTSFIVKQQIDIIKAARRSPTPEETRRLSEIFAKEYRTRSFAPPLGLTLGFYRAYKSRHTWSSPFHKASGNFNPEVVRFPGLGEILKGRLARSFWHSGRYAIYALIATCWAYLLVTPYAITVAGMEMTLDPRLKDLVPLALANKREASKQERARAGQQPHERDPYGQGSTSMNDLWKNHRHNIGGEELQQDDEASPTAGQAAGYSLEDGHSQSMFSGRPDNTPDNTSAQSPSQVSSNSNALPRHSPRRTGTRETSASSSQPLEDFDNAPPTESPPSSSAAPSPAGSAWDRVRQNAGSTGALPRPNKVRRDRAPPGSSSDDKSSGDDFSFSSADEDRQLARHEAQNEFDERLERERRGGDFNGSTRDGGGRRRW